MQLQVEMSEGHGEPRRVLVLMKAAACTLQAN